MITLYVTHPGSVLRRTGFRLIVEGNGSAPRMVRLREVERVVLVGNIGVTSAALAGLLAAGVNVSVLSHSGRALGQLCPAASKDVFIRQSQFEALGNEPLRLRIARRIVSGKLRNARRVAQRHARNHPDSLIHDAIAALQTARYAALRARSRAALMGIEGDASRVWFSALAKMLRAGPAFTGRNRRPPRDPVNALLSFGYTLLAGEIDGALAALGLDPHVGVLHELDYGRPSLALDILEEFRQPVIDRLVVTLINRRELGERDFTGSDERGVRLTDDGRSRFLSAYAEALATDLGGGAGNVHDIIRRQARRLRNAIRDRGDYAPWRYG